MIVIGAGFGDEGKGLTVSHLASKVENPLIVRYNGGHQAGHTVVKDDIRHVFSSFGSGTLQGFPTYWSENCTIYPIAFYNELQALLKNNIKPIFFAHPLCPITTPFDVFVNQNNNDNVSHGTCGVGFGTTIKRHFDDHYKLFLKDIFNETILLTKMDAIKKFYKIGLPYNLDSFYEKINFIKSYINIENELLYNYDPIFEGAQGLMLDQLIGFFPHVTRSNTGSKNVVKLCEDGLFNDVEDVTYVTRTYLTRHGNGPMPNEEHSSLLELKNFEKETNVLNKFQGEFRKTILDIDLLNYAIDADIQYQRIPLNLNLMITCVDQTGEDIYVTKDRKVKKINVKNLANELKFKFEKVSLSYSDDGLNIVTI